MDEYYRQIQDGKQIVNDYIQKKNYYIAQRVNALEWGRTPEDIKCNVHRLILNVGRRRYAIIFSEEELADAPGTPGGDRQLKNKIDEFFKSL